jgi:hypothetical protein
MRCPKCGSKDHICIVALVTVRLTTNEDGAVEGSEPVNGDHEWHGDSPAFCDSCNRAGCVLDFDPDDEEVWT